MNEHLSIEERGQRCRDRFSRIHCDIENNRIVARVALSEMKEGMSEMLDLGMLENKNIKKAVRGLEKSYVLAFGGAYPHQNNRDIWFKEMGGLALAFMDQVDRFIGQTAD